MTKPKTMTKTQAMHWKYATDARRMIEYDLHSVALKLRCLPKEWDEIWQDIDRRDPKKVPITIRLDADVVKFFKAMGEGYQPRINRVLRSFMHYRLAGIIDGPDTTDYVLQPDRMVRAGEERPAFGTLQQMEADIAERMARLGVMDPD
ncbi:MAG: BrnA antitoxin family protein [Pseudomonadota bacterium]